MESPVQSSLHENCHQHTMFAKLNLKINYPPLFEREVWHYQNGNVDQTRQAINKFPCNRPFTNININKRVQFFTQTTTNIKSNYIPQEIITHNDRNRSCIDQKIKKLVPHKNATFNSYCQDRNNTDLFNKFQFLQSLQLRNPSKSIIYS